MGDGGHGEQVQRSKVHEGCRLARAERRGTGATCSKKTINWEWGFSNSRDLFPDAAETWGLAPPTQDRWASCPFLTLHDPGKNAQLTLNLYLLLLEKKTSTELIAVQLCVLILCQ